MYHLLTWKELSIVVIFFFLNKKHKEKIGYLLSNPPDITFSAFYH